MAITGAWLKANYKKSRPKPLEKADHEGLSARLSPKGKITFTMRYLYGAEPKRLDIGSYPLMFLKRPKAKSRARAGA